MVAWGPLLRRLVRVLARVGLGYLVRRGRRSGRSRRARGRRDGTVIDVEPVGPFDRFTEPARRAVARATRLHDGGGLTTPGLLLGLVDSHPPTAASLAGAGVDLTRLRADLTQSVAAHRGAEGPTPGARRVLREARAHADRRAAFDVGPRDLLGALAGAHEELSAVLDDETRAALTRLDTG